MTDKKPLIVLAGPTAVGKTKLSIKLAKAIGGEIISADSMQVYRHMNIGSAKITPEEMEGVRHHLIDILNPTEEFNIVLFQKYAKEAIAEIYARNKLPIIAGGTGFYIQSVVYDIDFEEQAEESTEHRAALEAEAEKYGAHALHEKLAAVDPQAAEDIHENNVKRVIRALEFYYDTGKRISEHNQEQHEKHSPYELSYFVLNTDRETVYHNIDLRVDRMIEQGLIEEVRALREMGCRRDMVSMQGLGYKEILDYLDGKCTLENAVYTIKRDTRHFAKRQLTWMKREKDVIWINKNEYHDDETQILEAMLKKIRHPRNAE